MAQNITLISDAHIKARLWTNFSAITGDSYEALNVIKNDGSSHDILISCGDLHDVTRPLSVDHYAVRHYLEAFDTVLYIDGNHDLVQNSMVPLYGLKNAVCLSEKPYKMEDIDIFGSNYCNSREELLNNLQNIAANFRGNQNVVILHQALKEFLGFDGAYMLCAQDIWDILGEDVKVYIGDIHKQGLIKSPSGKGFILSPGPLVPQDLAQAKLQQYYYRLHSNGDYTEVPIKVRDFYEVDINTPEDVTKLNEIQRGILNLKPVIVTHSDKDLKWSTPKEVDDNFIVIRQYNKQEVATSTVAAMELTFDQAVEAEINETEQGNKKLTTLCLALTKVEDPVASLDKLITKIGAIR